MSTKRIGRDATDVEVDAEMPNEDEGVWKVVEKPSRDSDADAQASHPVSVPGTGTAHALTRFEDVASRVQDIMKRLIGPRKSYLAAWIKVHDVD